MRLITPGTLTIGACTLDAPPMTVLTEDGRTGFEPAVARAIGRELGLDVVYADTAFTDFYDRLEAGAVDAVMFNQTITPERLERAVFSTPYGLFNDAILVRAGSDIHHVDDLRGMTVGSVIGTANMEIAEQIDGATVVGYPEGLAGWQELLRDFAAGRVDAVCDDELVLRAMEPDGYRIIHVIATANPFGIGIAKDNPELLDAVNDALRRLVESGEMERMWNEWLPTPYELKTAYVAR